MKRILLISAFFPAAGAFAATGDICTNCPDLNPIASRADFDGTVYYASTLAADTADIMAFKTALNKDISARHKQLSYSEVWTALTFTDQDPANSSNVILIYKGISIPKNHNASGVNNLDYWNREHVWAKSHGFPGSSQHGYTDIHHLRPSDMSINGERGNSDFDVGGTAVTEAPKNYRNGDISWEPRDEVKGDVARMMFYMETRYEMGSDSDMPDLALVDRTGTSESNSLTSPGEMGKLCTLLAWHAVDPVDSFERNRNDVVFEYQGNRNPYIDHPEWSDIVYQDKCSAQVPLTPKVNISAPAEINEGSSVSLLASANLPKAIFLWQQTQGENVNATGTDTSSLNFIAPTVDIDTVLSFKVTITDADNAKSSASNLVNILVKNVSSPVPFSLDIASVTVVEEGKSITLQSTSNGDNPSYLWQQTAGPKVEIADATQASLVFTTPDVSLDTQIDFSLTVTDSAQRTLVKSISLTVLNTNSQTPAVTEPATPVASSSSGGALGSIALSLLVLLGFSRRLK
jgi:endonuclease I